MNDKEKKPDNTKVNIIKDGLIIKTYPFSLLQSDIADSVGDASKQRSIIESLFSKERVEGWKKGSKDNEKKE